MKFEILKNRKVVEVKDLGEGSHKVGRAPGCDIHLPSALISKHHALIVIKNGKAAIVDMGSANGVFVNGVLVRKQRIHSNDEVTIAEYQVRIAKNQSVRASSPASASAGGGFDGNLALNADANYVESPDMGAPPEISPQEKLLVLMDEKVLSPLYELEKKFDWRVLLVSIMGGGFLLSVLATVFSILPWGREIATQEALKRAHTVLGQVVRENYRIISKTNDATRLTVEAAEGESGILSISIVDPRANTIMAPATLFNKSVTDVHYLLAIEKMKEGVAFVDIPKGGDIYVVAQPISLSSTDSRGVSAMVIADFEVPKAVQAVYEPIVRSTLFAALLILLVFYLLTKMVSYPIVQMNEQLDLALKGENVSIGSEAKFPELENLATSINFAVSRMRQGSGANNLQQDDTEERRAIYIGQLSEFDEGTSDALILVDRDKKLIFIGRIAEKLLGIESQYAIGQNVAELIKDPSVAGTMLDLSENVIQSLGESRDAELKVNGVLRRMFAVGHKNQEGSVELVLLTVRMNETT